MENNNYELYHHGILGQKWGIRRYQNEDGSLTAEGEKRYYKNDGNLTVEGKKHDRMVQRELNNTAYEKTRLSAKTAARMIGGSALSGLGIGVAASAGADIAGMALFGLPGAAVAAGAAIVGAYKRYSYNKLMYEARNYLLETRQSNAINGSD